MVLCAFHVDSGGVDAMVVCIGWCAEHTLGETEGSARFVQHINQSMKPYWQCMATRQPALSQDNPSCAASCTASMPVPQTLLFPAILVGNTLHQRMWLTESDTDYC
eukprot:4409899-Amphidinium_carterae.1